MSGNTVLTVVYCSVNDLLRVAVSVASQFRKWYTGVIALLGVAYSNVVLGLHLITSFIIHAEHVVHRRGYCFDFGCMFVCLYVC